MSVECFSSGDLLSVRLGELFVEACESSVRAHGRCVIGVSGGSLPKILSQAIVANSSIPWSRCFFVFADERCTASLEDPDSNYGACALGLFSHLGAALPQENIVAVDPTLHHDPQAMAQSYQRALLGLFPAASPPQVLPVIDLLLLGMGPDGHTCSLFPGHPLLDERTLLVAPIFDSPKPPPTRVTLTLPVVNAAARVVFVCTGESKAAPLRDILESDIDGHLLPAKLVKPTASPVVWLVDEPAAKLLVTTPVKR